MTWRGSQVAWQKTEASLKSHRAVAAVVTGTRQEVDLLEENLVK